MVSCFLHDVQAECGMDTYIDDQSDAARQQERHYYLLSELQTLVKDLPRCTHHITSQKISWSSDYCQRNVIEARSKNRNSKVKSYSRVSAGLKKSYFHKLKAVKSEQKVLNSWSRRVALNITCIAKNKHILLIIINQDAFTWDWTKWMIKTRTNICQWLWKLVNSVVFSELCWIQ